MGFRQALLQTQGTTCITDGGMETVLLFHRGIDLPCFACVPAPRQRRRDERAALVLRAVRGDRARARRRPPPRHPDLACERRLGRPARLRRRTARGDEPEGSAADRAGAGRPCADHGDRLRHRRPPRRRLPARRPDDCRRGGAVSLDADRDAGRRRGGHDLRAHAHVSRGGDRDRPRRGQGRHPGRGLVHGRDRRPPAGRNRRSGTRSSGWTRRRTGRPPTS